MFREGRQDGRRARSLLKTKKGPPGSSTGKTAKRTRPTSVRRLAKVRPRRAGRAFRLNILLFGFVLLASLVWGVSFVVKDELRLRQLQRENRKIEPSVEALRREEVQLDKLRKELKVLTDLDRRKGQVLRVLDELTKVVPTNAYLSNFRYRDSGIEIQGSAENASALIPLMERSPLFENVGFNAPSNRGRDNRETFSLKANLEKAKDKEAAQR